MSLSKKAGLILVLIMAVAFAGYGIFWWTVARQISQQIDTIWVSMAAGGASTAAQKPSVYGFPAPPAFTFQGSITEANGTIWTFPNLTYRGFPLPGALMVLEAPQGFSIQGPLFPQPVEISEGAIFINLPHDLPANMQKQSLQAWQAKGGTIPIEYLQIRSGELNIVGKGHLALDEHLQLAGSVDARITGMENMLTDLADKGVIKGQSVSIAQNFLNMMMQVDPATNERFFIAQIKIQKRGVFFGPLRIGYLPEIIWDAADRQQPP